MPSALAAFDSGIVDDTDDFKKAERLAARAARFSKNAPGKRIKEVGQAFFGAFSLSFQSPDADSHSSSSKRGQTSDRPLSNKG